MNSISIKRNLREIKRLERKIRSGAGNGQTLVWDSFFDLRNTGGAKYSLRALSAMSRAEYKRVISEYWSFVYQSFFNENDLHAVSYDTGVLLRWGLPYNADEAAVKQRFRTLAKRSHPDTGGSAEMFIDLMRDYHQLIGK